MSTTECVTDAIRHNRVNARRSDCRALICVVMFADLDAVVYCVLIGQCTCQHF